MNVTWRQQIVAYCVLIVARMFSDDPALTQDLKSLSNRITSQQPDRMSQAATGRTPEFILDPGQDQVHT